MLSVWRLPSSRPLQPSYPTSEHLDFCDQQGGFQMLKADLVIIDPQNDFMDIKHDGSGWVGAAMPDGTLFRSTLPVPGALDDMRRVAKLIERVGHRLNDIHVTLDSHRVVDV